jgi:hypothetical protein
MKFKLTKRKKVILTIVVIVVSVAMLFFLWLQSGNKGSIKQNGTHTVQAINKDNKILDTKLMRFEYPYNYNARETQTTDVDLEMHQLDATTAYEKKISASVSVLPDGTLNSNSAYLLRKSRADLYRKRLDASSLAAEIWVSYDNKEQTVFIKKSNRVAVISFIQNGGDYNNLTKEVDALIESFKWK